MKHAITAVDAGSLAERAGIKAGWSLLAIDGRIVRDVVDYELFTSAEALTLQLEDENGEQREVRIEKEIWDTLGLNFTSGLMSKVRQCANHCVFCFIDQMPRGHRETLYFKDDDWRLSLIMGNYVTLTNVSDTEFKRILDRRVAPLYISVHATDGRVRTEMMRSRNADKIMERLTALHEHKLTFHCQIVLCPKLNGGKVLEKSLDDLWSLSPEARSVAVVPVGLTRHREGLYPLEPMTAEEAREAIAIVEGFAKAHNAKSFAYCSDEMYLRAKLPLPGYDYYGDFDQIENGVGLFRLFEEGFDYALADKAPLGKSIKIDAVSGKAIAADMAKLLSKLAGHGIDVCHHSIENDFFGTSVTVSGLVTAGDIIKQLGGKLEGSALIIPATMLRERDDVFLDGMRLGELEEALGRPVYPLPADDGEAFITELFEIAERMSRT